MKEIYKNQNAILKINLKNIELNYNKLKKVAPNINIAACVKANCYGLGSQIVCKTLSRLKCKNFFVATLEEAIILRKQFKKENIYLLNGINDLESYNEIKKNNIITVVNNIEQFNLLKKIFTHKKEKIKSCLHIDSGMNRLGFSIEAFLQNLESFKKYLNLQLVMSHLINSEKKSYINNRQLRIFLEVKKQFDGVFNCYFSLGNSNATFLNNSFHFDLIRAGGYLYGLDLSKYNKSKNVITLKAKIIQIQLVKAGQSIGYGATYKVKKQKTIATLAIGYADGMPRNYQGFVYYKKSKAKFVGKISMDLSCIDVSNIKNPKVNDWVEIFGDNISISLFSSKCHTIPYEISSKIGTRVKRIYIA